MIGHGWQFHSTMSSWQSCLGTNVGKFHPIQITLSWRVPITVTAQPQQDNVMGLIQALSDGIQSIGWSGRHHQNDGKLPLSSAISECSTFWSSWPDAAAAWLPQQSFFIKRHPPSHKDIHPVHEKRLIGATDWTSWTSFASLITERTGECCHAQSQLGDHLLLLWHHSRSTNIGKLAASVIQTNSKVNGTSLFALFHLTSLTSPHHSS